MRLLIITVFFLFNFILFIPHFVTAAENNPIATDSRIRTYVYGENEVYKVITKFGYQSNIEFAIGEEIQTLSVGDAVAWKITPAGNRLFVKALEENVDTNLTVVTSERAYQFDLSSAVSREEDITYVVRFFYPQRDFDSSQNVPQDNVFESGALVEAAYNFNYSLTGPRQIAPLQVFDDGRFTFFKFPNNNNIVPRFFVIARQGAEVPVVTRNDGEFVVVERVYKQFALRRGDDIVCVFNDTLVGKPPNPAQL